jgi:endonuclease/exonuclease/phosphatase (EEP) superfamily protein YafD
VAEWPAEWARDRFAGVLQGDDDGRARLAPVLELRRPEPETPAPAVRLRLLVPAVTLLAAWAATCLVDGLPGPLDRLAVAAAALSPFAVIAAIPVVALALRGGLRSGGPPAVVAAVAALVPWLFVLGYASPADAGPPGDGGVRVSAMLLDADGGRADPPSIVAAVARQPVDLLVVTGATGLLAHELTTAGLDPRLRPRWASATRPGSGDATLVWSRYPVTRVDPVLGASAPAVRLVLDTGGAPLTVVAGAASTARGTGTWRADLAALGSAAGVRGPVALLGSLDATPQQAAFRRMVGTGLTDAADALGRGPRPTWPSWSPLPFLPVDHVLVGGGIGVRAASTLPVAGTAHRALVTSLAVPVAEPPSGTSAGAD